MRSTNLADFDSRWCTWEAYERKGMNKQIMTRCKKYAAITVFVVYLVDRS